MFPSPLGVIFSLINFKKWVIDAYGVCFRLLSELYSLLYVAYTDDKYVAINSFRLLSELYSLLYIGEKYGMNGGGHRVSVSSRSYILSYSLIHITAYIGYPDDKSFPSPLGVIFSLISTISKLLKILGYQCFRLLSELYSLLFILIWWRLDVIIMQVSVSSRSYILSYKNDTKTYDIKIKNWFPSPLGVIFSLIRKLL